MLDMTNVNNRASGPWLIISSEGTGLANIKASPRSEIKIVSHFELIKECGEW